MHSPALKYLRYTLSLLVFSAFSLLFLDFRAIVPVQWYNAVTWIQFGPSLLKFVVTGSIIATGFAAVLVLTLLFGRIYCSALCPLGIMQDLIIRLKKWTAKHKSKFRYKKPLRWRYFFLALSAISLAAGILLVYNLLDPYSNFGRIFSSAVRPVLIGLNNLLGFAGDKTGWFQVNRYPLKGFDLATLVWPVAVLLLIAVMAWRRGRLFCNLLCPVGALLGLVSRYSLFRIVLDKSKCNQCGLCQAECKAECISIKTQEIDYSRCVMCFNCIGPCPDKGFELVRPAFKPLQRQPDSAAAKVSETRRRLLGSAVLLGFAGNIAAQVTKQEAFEKPTKIAEKKDCAVSPPGSVSVDEFVSKCIACHLCVSACPTQVLQPSLLQYGLQGFLQPHMDFGANFCNYECVVCSQVCPTGAIKPITALQKKKIQLGRTTFVKENCVVYTFNTACGACSEHCPTKAVNMVPYLNGLTIPAVDQKICVGCGACEHACPTKPYKAIYVNGNPVHLAALPPKQDKIKRDADSEDWAF